MASYPDALDHMLATWNEADAAKIKNHLVKALNSNIRTLGQRLSAQFNCKRGR
jgi:hypothetical protein